MNEILKDNVGEQGTIDYVKSLEKEIIYLKKSVEKLKLPGRCYVCGEPTDGFVRVLFIKTWYCKAHFPIGVSLG